MKNLPVPQPTFLAQPCTLPPLLVSETDAGRLLALGRSQIKGLIAEGLLCRVEAEGLSRITMASIVGYVDRLGERGGKRPAAVRAAGQVTVLDLADNQRLAGRPTHESKEALHATHDVYDK